MPQAHQTLILFKRHLRGCTVHKSRVPVKDRKYWFECDCPIWITGRTSEAVVPRQSTGCTNLKQAEAFRETLLPKDETPDPVKGVSISDCVEKYLVSRREELKDRSYQQNKLALDRLRRFFERRSMFHMSNLTVDLIETFKVEGLPDLKSTSRSTAMYKVQCFLKEAYRRGWIKEDLVPKINLLAQVPRSCEDTILDRLARCLDVHNNVGVFLIQHLNAASFLFEHFPCRVRNCPSTFNEDS